jgi:hypothetical protein
MALLTLAVFSSVAGILILWVFKLTSNQRALRVTRRRVMAHLLALRLFGDDPAAVLRSQARLLWWNARYMALLLPPFLVVAIPLYVAWDHLDALWGRAPLKSGDTAVVTAQLRGGATRAELTAPPWLAIETPPVRSLATHEVSWRVRVLRAGSGEMSVRVGTEQAGLMIDARPGLHYRGERGTASGAIEWVEIRYPRTELALLGISTNWVVWFCVISTITALAFRGKLRVTF